MASEQDNNVPSSSSITKPPTTSKSATPPQTFLAEYDDEGVYFYQAFKDSIADYAINNQKLGGPDFKQDRMTWIKPNFAWVLYRSGYGRKSNQERILKIKISHENVAKLLKFCICTHGSGGGNGRVQWDPSRDLYLSEKGGKEPRKVANAAKRMIQIGLKAEAKDQYINSIMSITDVTTLSKQIGIAHGLKVKNDSEMREAVEKIDGLPVERAYMPKCDDKKLIGLGLLPNRR